MENNIECFELMIVNPPYYVILRLMASDLTFKIHRAKEFYSILKSFQLPDSNGVIKPYVFPSREKLARRMNVTPRYIDKLREELRRTGYIIEKPSRNKGIEYWFSIPYIRTIKQLIERFNYTEHLLQTRDIFGIQNDGDDILMHTSEEVTLFYRWFAELENEKQSIREERNPEKRQQRTEMLKIKMKQKYC